MVFSQSINDVPALLPCVTCCQGKLGKVTKIVYQTYSTFHLLVFHTDMTDIHTNSLTAMFRKFDVTPHHLSHINPTKCNVCLIASIASWQARLFRASYGAMGENEEVSRYVPEVPPPSS